MLSVSSKSRLKAITTHKIATLQDTVEGLHPSFSAGLTVLIIGAISTAVTMECSPNLFIHQKMANKQLLT